VLAPGRELFAAVKTAMRGHRTRRTSLLTGLLTTARVEGRTQHQPFEVSRQHAHRTPLEVGSRRNARIINAEDRMAIRTTRNVGMLLLGIWLIVTGISGFAALPIPGVVMAALALIAGVLILLGM
jgi:hypothetical protein